MSFIRDMFTSEDGRVDGLNVAVAVAIVTIIGLMFTFVFVR